MTILSDSTMIWLRAFRVVLAVASLSAAPVLQAQSGVSPGELNRSGKWNEAVTLAAKILANDSLSVLERCETLSQVVYALGRLRRNAEARARGDDFKRACSTLPATHWIAVEVARALSTLEAPTKSPGRASIADDWKVGEPGAAGLDTSVVRAHRQLCERSAADACLVIRKGVLVDEWYGPDYSEPITAMSSTKSVTGLLIGLLVADGKLGLDDSVSRFIPEWRAGAAAGVRVRHLLNMTSGLPDNRTESDVGLVADKEAFAFGLPLTRQPGERWAYTNNGVFLLSPVMKRAAAEPVADFAARRLFRPVGMLNTRMHVYPDGQAWTHADMETTARDFARIGQLTLERGKWRDVQIIPETWVQASTAQSQDFARYGLLWWLDVPDGFAARGYLDTNLYVFPSRDLVIVRMQAKPKAGADRYEPEAQKLFARMVQSR